MASSMTPTAETPPSRPGSRAEIFAWTMYDWANSAYSTLLITVVLHYVQQVVAADEVTGAILFPACISISMLIAAVLSPLVGAMADANRSKRRWLAGTALSGAAAAVLMACAPSDAVWLILPAFVAMNVLFDLSLVPYNGFLPEITDERTINRVSTWGFALGYLGGSIPLLVVAMLVRYGESLGLPEAADQDRVGILILGLWWGVFSLPSILILRDRGGPPERREPLPRAARNAVRQVGRTLASLRSFPMLSLFLLAYLFYNDGIQTVVTQSTTLASKDFHFTLAEMCWLVLWIQWIALPASLLVGWLADYLGRKPTLLTCLAVWIGLLVAVALIDTKGEDAKTQLWIVAIVLALVLGGTQAVGRAIMGSITPPQHAAEFFGFFNLSGKAASFLGPALFALVVWLTGGQTKLAALSILVFFLIGAGLLTRVDVKAGRQQALDAGA
jgi:UMF1 family MFS transporter